MHSTGYLYGEDPSKYKTLRYVDALKERYIDATMVLMELRYVGRVWNDHDYAKAADLQKAIKHNEQLLIEMEEEEWLKTIQKECVVKSLTESIHQQR